MLGDSRPMQELAAVVERVARLRVPALLRGESGSGKELAARALHALSKRSAGPFVAINGASLSESLAASTLFGHVRGAFTGANNPRVGAFRRADGGTLFVDEIASVPRPTQALLLRVLEDFAVTPVGGDASAEVDVRLVTATCEDLELAVHRGQFRADLYQRIATCIVRIPPLRRRIADLPVLAEAALEQTPGLSLAPGATSALQRHPFPGNVRELRNIVLQAAIHADGDVITADDLARVLAYRGAQTATVAPDITHAAALALLARAAGNISEAARMAGLPRSTFRDRLRKARRALGGREGES
jgi:DNA-binding NtrC family response regulator